MQPQGSSDIASEFQNQSQSHSQSQCPTWPSGPTTTSLRARWPSEPTPHACESHQALPCTPSIASLTHDNANATQALPQFASATSRRPRSLAAPLTTGVPSANCEGGWACNHKRKHSPDEILPDKKRYATNVSITKANGYEPDGAPVALLNSSWSRSDN